MALADGVTVSVAVAKALSVSVTVIGGGLAVIVGVGVTVKVAVNLMVGVTVTVAEGVIFGTDVAVSIIISVGRSMAVGGALVAVVRLTDETVAVGAKVKGSDGNRADRLNLPGIRSFPKANNPASKMTKNNRTNGQRRFLAAFVGGWGGRCVTLRVLPATMAAGIGGSGRTRWALILVLANALVSASINAAPVW